MNWKQGITYFLTVAIFCVLFGSIQATLKAQEKTKMDMDIPSNVGCWMYICGIDTTDITKIPLPDDVDNARIVLICFDTVTDRLHIFEKDGDHHEIPTLTNDLDRIPQTYCPLFLDSDGNLATAPSGATEQAWMDVGLNPKYLKWPQITSPDALPETVMANGTSGLVLSGAPVKVADVELDLSVGTKQNLYTVLTGHTFVVDYYVLYGASEALDTVEFGTGFNANADDVTASQAYDHLDSTSKVFRHVMSGAYEEGASEAVLGAKCTVTQTATVQIEVYGHYVD